MLVNMSHCDLWQDFCKDENLSVDQLNKFIKYFEILKKHSKNVNLTAILDLNEVLMYHFRDSLELKRHIDLKSINSICDIGTGAGFPGIPLKIVNDHLFLVLLEVNNKKIKFLEHLIEELSLKNVIVCSLDWRTFLRSTDFDIDLFCARASLKVTELTRFLKSGCIYKDSSLVYWASDKWEPKSRELEFLVKKSAYSIG